MSPAPHDITIVRGDDFLLFFKVREPNGGPYVDITGWTGRAQARETKEAPDPPAATFTVTILDQAVSLGGVTVELDRTLTQGLALPNGLNVGVYDVELTEPGVGGDRTTYLGGDVHVEQDVTR